MKKRLWRHWMLGNQRIRRRLDRNRLGKCSKPVMTAGNIDFEVGERTQAIACGGIGAVHLLARKFGLAEAIDARVHVLKIHLPYHESDHVLALAYLPLCNGHRLDDLELLRQDKVFLDALGAQRIPDPTTAGDFCRRFGAKHLQALQEAIDDVRLRVWAEQPATFFDQAIIEMDGTMVETQGECKQGVDINHKGQWGYHALLVSLANTGEVLRLVNRPGNRPSHEGAAEQVDQVLELCRRGGFRRVLLRGDTDFSQTEHLDRWQERGDVKFVFGYDAKENLKDMAERLPDLAWRPLQRPLRQIKTEPRRRRRRVKDKIVRARGFETLRLLCEEVAEFNYRPHACRHTYRMVVVRKHISREKGEAVLFPEIRYFFYLTNDWVSDADEIVFTANDRCHQENLLAQLHGGVCSLRAPLDTLLSNWAYMVMTTLAWNLKAWWALCVPAEPGRWQEQQLEEKTWALKVEFRTFVNAFINIPCQIVRTGRRLLYKILSWSPREKTLFRLVTFLRC